MSEPLLTLDYGMSGRYQIHKYKSDSEGNAIESTKELAADWFDNLITNAGLDNIGKTTTYNKFLGIVIGTGNTPPAYTDVSLASYLTQTTTVQSGWVATRQISTSPYYVAFKITYRFGTGVAAGNITEVGIAGATTATPGPTSTLFSRALITDGTGTPITITVLSDEILDVTYELRIYPPNGGADITGTFNMTISGTPTAFNYTLRPAAIITGDPAGTTIGWAPYAFNNNAAIAGYINPNFNLGGGCSQSTTLGGLGGYPPTPNDYWDSVSNSTYVSGNYYIDITYGASLNRCNFASGINSMFFLNTFQAAAQMSISPAVMKNNTQTFTYTVRFTWGRYP